MKKILVAGLMLTSSGLLIAARGAEFVVQPGGKNRVVFVSTAPMEQFEGKTDRVEGRLTVQPPTIGDSFTVRFEVDLTALDTGIALRNRHMRENHLETGKYPKAVFEGAKVVAGQPVQLQAGKQVTFEIEGSFTLHGVTRPLRARVDATYRPGGSSASIEFRASFPVELSSFSISRPEFLFLKLADTQQVRVEGIAVAVPSP